MPDDYIQEGYIILARKIRKSSLWKSLKATHRLVMLEILLQAQFKDGEVARNGEIIFLKRGQLATSYQQLVDDIDDKDITIKVVRNAINKLIKHEFLTKDEGKAKSKKGLLLTISNYDLYQNPDNYKGQIRSENKSDFQPLNNHQESKTPFLGNVDGKAETTENPYVSTDYKQEENEEGKETGITRAKQGQSKGKARAINNNVNNVNNVYELKNAGWIDRKGFDSRENLFTAIENRYIELRGRGLSIGSEDDKVIRDLLNDNIPLQTILDGMEKSFKNFTPRYKGDKIRTFSYCEPAIRELNYRRTEKSERRKPNGNSKPRTEEDLKREEYMRQLDSLSH